MNVCSLTKKKNECMYVGKKLLDLRYSKSNDTLTHTHPHHTPFQ